MEYGITYIVLPCIEFVYKARSFAYISSGAIQLFIGPASSFVGVQINVLSSTRATSLTAVL